MLNALLVFLGLRKPHITPRVPRVPPTPPPLTAVAALAPPRFWRPVWVAHARGIAFGVGPTEREARAHAAARGQAHDTLDARSALAWSLHLAVVEVAVRPGDEHLLTSLLGLDLDGDVRVA